MIEEIVGGVFKSIGRFLIETVIQTVIEILVKGPGYVIANTLSDKKPDKNSHRVTIYGLLFWFLVITAGYYIYPYYRANSNA